MKKALYRSFALLLLLLIKLFRQFSGMHIKQSVLRVTPARKC